MYNNVSCQASTMNAVLRASIKLLYNVLARHQPCCKVVRFKCERTCRRRRTLKSESDAVTCSHKSQRQHDVLDAVLHVRGHPDGRVGHGRALFRGLLPPLKLLNLIRLDLIVIVHELQAATQIFESG